MPPFEVDEDRTVQARLPFWFKQMAQEIGDRATPTKSVGEVLAGLYGSDLKERYQKLPPLGQSKSPSAEDE